MTDDTTPAASGGGTPWHLWVVALIGIIWNGFGATDFVMTFVDREMWFQTMRVTAEQAARVDAMPAWTYGAWLAGTWGAFLGTVALLFRSRWAVYLFWVSMIGLLVSIVYAFGLSSFRSELGTQDMIRYGVIFLGAAFFLWYSTAMARRGVLR